MSKIKYSKDNKVIERKGEYFEIGSCSTTPRSVVESLAAFPDMDNDPLFAKLEGDVDELLNKPRRFFDHMLSIVEYQRDNDPMLNEGNHREYWQHLIKGCEMWLSAVENGLYGEVERLAEKKAKP